MPLSVPLEAAYHLISSTVHTLEPLFGNGSAAVAVVAFTIAVRVLLLPLTLWRLRAEHAHTRVLPKVQELRQRHRADPLTLGRELKTLYRTEGGNPLTGCLPGLLQAPFFMLTYRLFASANIAGQTNTLLAHGLFGVPLAARLLSGALLGWHGLVFVGVLALIAAVALVTARRLGRLGQPLLARLMPFTTVAFACFVPLAVALYLLTTTAWTALENSVLRPG
jgi:YidC/Oxa1 family membrane protein insertase